MLAMVARAWDRYPGGCPQKSGFSRPPKSAALTPQACGAGTPTPQACSVQHVAEELPASTWIHFCIHHGFLHITKTFLPGFRVPEHGDEPSITRNVVEGRYSTKGQQDAFYSRTYSRTTGKYAIVELRIPCARVGSARCF